MEENKKCWRCGRPALEHCYSDAGRREVEISGLCEECYDKMMNEPKKDGDDRE